MKGKILLYTIYVIAGVLLTVSFVTATTYTQLAIATLFYPPIAYLIFKSFPGRKRGEVLQQSTVTAVQPISESLKGESGVFDIDKRSFLKLIGSAGLSFFIFSIFTRRSEAIFFGKALESGPVTLEDKDGNKINPAERQPTDGYQISEIDEGEPTYFGYIHRTGNWYIMKQDTETGSFRYIKGDTDFPKNWNNRQNHTYDYFYNVFT